MLLISIILFILSVSITVIICVIILLLFIVTFYSNTCSVVRNNNMHQTFFILMHIVSRCVTAIGHPKKRPVDGSRAKTIYFYIVCSKSLAKQGAERELRQGCRLCRPRRRRVSPSYALFIFCVVDERKRRTKQLKPHKCLLLCG